MYLQLSLFSSNDDGLRDTLFLGPFSFDDNMTLEWSDRKHMIEHPINRTAAPLKMKVLPESFGAAMNRAIQGSMKKGEMMRIVCRTPYKTGKVKHSSALSPATSEKSFVTEAPKIFNKYGSYAKDIEEWFKNCRPLFRVIL